MRSTIIEKLKYIERHYDVKILYACESGSRAWGFASPDSDYDVRFIYAHKLDYYLSINEHRDVIELPINDLLDINGWELRKTLRLFRKSNASLFEWLKSPVVYLTDTAFIEEMRGLMSYYFSPRAGMHHYISMTKAVFENELSGSMVKLKKYFYALRPVLAAKWIADANSVPPMDFESLRVLIPERINSIANEMLSIKAKADETFMIARNEELHSFIIECMHYCEARVPTPCYRNDVDDLDAFFKRTIA